MRLDTHNQQEISTKRVCCVSPKLEGVLLDQTQEIVLLQLLVHIYMYIYLRRTYGCAVLAYNCTTLRAYYRQNTVVTPPKAISSSEGSRSFIVLKS